MILHPVVQAVAERTKALDASVRSGSLHLTDAIGQYTWVTKENGLGMGHLASAVPTEANDRDYSIPFVVSVLDEDRDGDIVIPMGCQLGNYEKNPVWFFGHQSEPFPIAKSRSPDGRLCVYPEDNRIRAVAFFDAADEDAMFVYGKVKRGFLNATSIAFVPIEAYKRDAHEEARFKAKPHRDPTMPMGWIFKQYDLTEISIVGVPSNAGAIRDALDKEKGFIRPRLQKALARYAAKASDCWMGWCPPCVAKEAAPVVVNAGAAPIRNFLSNPNVAHHIQGGKAPAHVVNALASDYLRKMGTEERQEAMAFLQAEYPALASAIEATFPQHAKAVKSCGCTDCSKGHACGCGTKNGHTEKGPQPMKTKDAPGTDSRDTWILERHLPDAKREAEGHGWKVSTGHKRDNLVGGKLVMVRIAGPSSDYLKMSDFVSKWGDEWQSMPRKAAKGKNDGQPCEQGQTTASGCKPASGKPGGRGGKKKPDRRRPMDAQILHEPKPEPTAYSDPKDQAEYEAEFARTVDYLNEQASQRRTPGGRITHHGDIIANMDRPVFGFDEERGPKKQGWADAMNAMIDADEEARGRNKPREEDEGETFGEMISNIFSGKSKSMRPCVMLTKSQFLKQWTKRGDTWQHSGGDLKIVERYEGFQLISGGVDLGFFHSLREAGSKGEELLRAGLGRSKSLRTKDAMSDIGNLHINDKFLLNGRDYIMYSASGRTDQDDRGEYRVVYVRDRTGSLPIKVRPGDQLVRKSLRTKNGDRPWGPNRDWRSAFPDFIPEADRQAFLAAQPQAVWVWRRVGNEHYQITGMDARQRHRPELTQAHDALKRAYEAWKRGQGKQARSVAKNINDDVERIVREWPQWSRAERERLDDIVEEVLQHARDGQGNRFIRDFYQRVVDPKIRVMRPSAFKQARSVAKGDTVFLVHHEGATGVNGYVLTMTRQEAETEKTRLENLREKIRPKRVWIEEAPARMFAGLNMGSKSLRTKGKFVSSSQADAEASKLVKLLERYAKLRDDAEEELKRAFPAAWRSGQPPAFAQGYNDRKRTFEEYKRKCEEIYQEYIKVSHEADDLHEQGKSLRTKTPDTDRVYPGARVYFEERGKPRSGKVTSVDGDLVEIRWDDTGVSNRVNRDDLDNYSGKITLTGKGWAKCLRQNVRRKDVIGFAPWVALVIWAVAGLMSIKPEDVASAVNRFIRFLEPLFKRGASPEEAARLLKPKIENEKSLRRKNSTQADIENGYRPPVNPPPGVRGEDDKALHPSTRTRPELGPSNVHDLVKPGDTLVARSYIHAGDKHIASTGDPLKVESVDDVGSVVVRNREGLRAKVGVYKLRLKGYRRKSDTVLFGSLEVGARFFNVLGYGPFHKISRDRAQGSDGMTHFIRPQEEVRLFRHSHKGMRVLSKGWRMLRGSESEPVWTLEGTNLTIAQEYRGSVLRQGTREVGVFHALQEAGAEGERLAGRKGKSLSELSGSSGGYTISPEKTETQPCDKCRGTGNCPICAGGGETEPGRDCRHCGGSGNCPACQGAGRKSLRSIHRKGSTVSRRKSWQNSILDYTNEVATEFNNVARFVKNGRPWAVTRFDFMSGTHSMIDHAYAMLQSGAGDQTPYKLASALVTIMRRDGKYQQILMDVNVVGSEKNHKGSTMSRKARRKQADVLPEDEEFLEDDKELEATDEGLVGEEPFTPKPSAKMAAHVYQHAKSESDFLEDQLATMDNPAMKEALTDYHENFVKARMGRLKEILHEHHGGEGDDDPDTLMDKCVKGLEADGVGGHESNPGELGSVEEGDVPPDSVEAGWDDGFEEEFDPTRPDPTAKSRRRRKGMRRKWADDDDEGIEETKGQPGPCPECGHHLNDGDVGPSGDAECPSCGHEFIMGQEKSDSDEEWEWGEEDPADVIPESKSDIGSAKWEAEEEDEEAHKADGSEDVSTDQILERYQQPGEKRWRTRKVGVLRRTKDGRTYLVRKGEDTYEIFDNGRKVGEVTAFNPQQAVMEYMRENADEYGDTEETPNDLSARKKSLRRKFSPEGPGGRDWTGKGELEEAEDLEGLEDMEKDEEILIEDEDDETTKSGDQMTFNVYAIDRGGSEKLVRVTASSPEEAKKIAMDKGMIRIVRVENAGMGSFVRGKDIDAEQELPFDEEEDKCGPSMTRGKGKTRTKSDRPASPAMLARFNRLMRKFKMQTGARRK